MGKAKQFKSWVTTYSLFQEDGLTTTKLLALLDREDQRRRDNQVTFLPHTKEKTNLLPEIGLSHNMLKKKIAD